jgi:quinol monooxygenase YgiN
MLNYKIMEEKIVIVGYRPKPGKAEALHQLMREHLPTLKSLDLVTDRASIMMEAEDGTIIEVFEWKSAAAIEQAHSNPEVLKMWEKFAGACDYIPVGQVEEIGKLFSSFKPFY